MSHTHRYKIEFLSGPLDESRLRDLLETSLGLSGISVTREGLREPDKAAGANAGAGLTGVTNTPDPHVLTAPTEAHEQASTDTLPARISAKILKLLAEGKPWRRKALLAHCGLLTNPQLLDYTLRGMVHTGLIQKVRPGIFIAANAPAPSEVEIPPLHEQGWQWPGGASRRLLELLAAPKSALELKDALGVSRQRVHQLLDQGILIGKITRTGTYGHYLYTRQDNLNLDKGGVP